MPATTDTPPDLTLPALDVRGLARRAAVPTAVLAFVAGALVLAGGPLQAFADALRRALAADPRWVVAGAGFELLSFAGYIALLWLVGRRASERLDARASAEITLGGAAATRLLPTGGVGGAALTIWALRRAGLGARGATRTLLAFLVTLYSVFLGSVAVSGGLIALGAVHTDGPFALAAVPAAIAVTGIAAGLALAARSRRAEHAAAAPAATPVDGAARSRLARIRSAAGETPAAIGLAVRDALALVRSGDVRLLGALAWWGFDAAVLYATLHAFGEAPPLAVVVLGYFLGQVANTIPIPGAVSGGMVGVLIAFGVAPAGALAAVLAYRSIAIWLPAPIGLAALNPLRRTIARWSAEDDGAQPTATVHPMPVRPRPVPVAA